MLKIFGDNLNSKKDNIQYKLYEDDGGGLSLVIYDINNNILWAKFGYEYDYMLLYNHLKLIINNPTKSVYKLGCLGNSGYLTRKQNFNDFCIFQNDLELNYWVEKCEKYSNLIIFIDINRQIIALNKSFTTPITNSNFELIGIWKLYESYKLS